MHANAHPIVPHPSVAVVIPCLNEGATIAQVVGDAQKALPHATVIVFDNASTDDTSTQAQAAGAEVIYVSLRGKGNVVRRMFADVDADILVMVDGDATYDLSCAPAMIEQLVRDGLDMVVGQRVSEHLDRSTYRFGHRAGNVLLTRAVNRMFRGHFQDILSGYRILSRRYVKSFPALARGFEIETELTVHALELRMACAEVPTPYFSRPEGSTSKLSTYRDGARILRVISKLFINERPLTFFGHVGFVLILCAFVLAVPVFRTYLDTHTVPRFPTAMLSLGMTLMGGLSMLAGIILQNVTLGRQEAKRLAYLRIPPTPRAYSPRGDSRPPP